MSRLVVFKESNLVVRLDVILAMKLYKKDKSEEKAVIEIYGNQLHFKVYFDSTEEAEKSFLQIKKGMEDNCND